MLFVGGTVNGKPAYGLEESRDWAGRNISDGEEQKHHFGVSKNQNDHHGRRDKRDSRSSRKNSKLLKVLIADRADHKKRGQPDEKAPQQGGAHARNGYLPRMDYRSKETGSRWNRQPDKMTLR